MRALVFCVCVLIASVASGQTSWTVAGDVAFFETKKRSSVSDGVSFYPSQANLLVRMRTGGHGYWYKIGSDPWRGIGFSAATRTYQPRGAVGDRMEITGTAGASNWDLSFKVNGVVVHRDRWFHADPKRGRRGPPGSFAGARVLKTSGITNESVTVN